MSTLRKGPPLEKARDVTASFEGGFKSDDDDDDDDDDDLTDPARRPPGGEQR